LEILKNCLQLKIFIELVNDNAKYLEKIIVQSKTLSSFMRNNFETPDTSNDHAFKILFQLMNILISTLFFFLFVSIFCSFLLKVCHADPNGLMTQFSVILKMTISSICRLYNFLNSHLCEITCNIMVSASLSQFYWTPCSNCPTRFRSNDVILIFKRLNGALISLVLRKENISHSIICRLASTSRNVI